MERETVNHPSYMNIKKVLTTDKNTYNRELTTTRTSFTTGRFLKLADLQGTAECRNFFNFVIIILIGFSKEWNFINT